MKALAFIFSALTFLLPELCLADDGPLTTITPGSTAFYTEYSSKEFLSLETLNQPIDFENPETELLNAAVFHLTNQEREKRKIKPLQFLPALRNAAQFHSEQMRDLKFYSHTNKKGGAFATHTDRIRYFGGNSSYTGENIHTVMAVKIKYTYRYYWVFSKKQYSFTPLTYLKLAKEIVNGWMRSRGHRANILNKNYRYLGCGNALPMNPSKNRKTLYNLSTQNFGS